MPPVLMAVTEMTCSLVRSPPEATGSGSWPVKIWLSRNSVKDTACRCRCIYGAVELALSKLNVNISWCPTEEEKQQAGDFQLRLCSSTETLLGSAIPNLLEGITVD